MNRNHESWLWAGFVACALLFTPFASRAAGNKSSPQEAKVAVYIQIINDESNHLLGNYDGYTKRVKDLKKGPTCQEPGSQSWLSSMGTVSERVATYRKGLAKQPKLEVDGAAKDMVDALEALEKPVAEASEYYFSSKYNQDHCKRGLELHPILMANWTKYLTGEQAVRVFLDKYTDDRDAAALAAAQKKYGKALHYYQLKLMMDAKALIKIGNARNPDLAALRERSATFTATIAEATPIVEKAKKSKDADALYQGGYQQLMHYAEELRSATEEVLRVLDKELKDPKALAGTNSRSSAFQNLLTAYNGLVDQSNQTMYSKTMK
jgi:hypothetical protein